MTLTEGPGTAPENSWTAPENSATTPDGAHAAPDSTGSADDGCLGGCGTAAVVAGILVLFGLVMGYLFLQSRLPRAAEAVTVAAVWQEANAVQLPADSPVATGVLTITSPGPLAPNARVAVTVGLPTAGPSAGEPSADPAPADVLRLPPVRLSVTLSPGTVVTCLAPCEIDLGNRLSACAPGSCRVVHEVRLEGVETAAGAPGSPLVVDLAGGVTAPLGERLPDGLAVQLTVEGATPSPQASP